MKKKLAVILINYNGINDTKECIESINSFEHSVDVSIVVVDNNSSEDEGKKLKDYYCNSNVVVICSEKNTGFSIGNNIGIKYAVENGFDYVLILNNDTIVTENTINELIAESGGKVICTSKIMCYDTRTEYWYGGGYLNPKTGKADNLAYVDSEKTVYCNYSTGCCMLFLTDDLKKYGGFEEDFFMYCEDVELCVRYLSEGYRIKYVPKSVLYHKESRSTGGNGSPLSNYYTTRNRMYCIKKHPEFFGIFSLWFSWITRIIRIIQFRIKGKKQWKAIWCGLRDYRKGITGKLNNIDELNA